MEITQKIGIHNKYEITVTDSRTGEVRQRAVGYNVVLNQYYTVLFGSNSYDSWRLLNQIGIGTGTATPAVTDTTLTNGDTASTTDVEVVYAYPTSHRTVQAVFGTSVGAGKTYTEVGLQGYVREGQSYYYISRALLQDAEGNPISIVKTNTDVLTVTATFYCTYTSGGIGSNGIYPAEPSQNRLVQWCLGVSYRPNRVYFTPYSLDKSEDLQRLHANGTDTIVATVTTNVASQQATFAWEVPQNSHNSQQIQVVGIPGYGAIRFPDSSLLQYYRITGETIATADGTQTQFDFSAPTVKSGSVHIFFDGTETPSSGYTVDYNSNCTDRWGLYATATMTLEDTTHVKCGDWGDMSAGTSKSYEPFAFASECTATTGKSSQYIDITSAKPCWFDFTNATRCNTLRIDMPLPAAQYDNVVIEYSSDNTAWTAVTYTRDADGTRYTFPTVTARYWRFYVNGYTMEVGGYRSDIPAKDGQPKISNRFALGYTGHTVTFATAPTAGTVITATYDVEIPYKTEHNLLRGSFVINFGAV